MGIKQFLPSKNSVYDTGIGMKLVNPQKYLGDPKKILIRSSYERKFFKECDLDEKIAKWTSEPEWLKVKYISPLDDKWHSYYPDVYCEKIIRGKTVKFLIEIKPSEYLKKPKKPTKMTRSAEISYQKKLKRFIIIATKKKYAEAFAKANDMVYLFLTERHIFKDKKKS